MASLTALMTGLTGLNANARKLDVIGNNIANANTTAFKASRMMFQTQFSLTPRDGTAPTTDTGGTNPFQIGMGVEVAGTQRNFGNGVISPTGDARDMAIDGKGLFVVRRGVDQFYTRAGAFRQDRDNNLVDINGNVLMGFGVDGDFQVQTGALSPLNIPVGSLSVAQATRNARFAGNLNASGAVATTGSTTTLGGTTSTGLSVIPGALFPPTAPNVIEPTSFLLEVADPLAPSVPLFSPGQVIEVRGAERGTRVIPEARFPILGTSTVADLMTFLGQALGLNAAADPPTGALPAGVTLDSLTGLLTITGNVGTVNSLEIETTDIRVLDSGGQFVRNPFVTTTAGTATGESVRTSTVVYDSLGTPITLDMSFVLEGKDSNGTTWRYFADSPDDTDLSSNLATGLVRFDTLGQLQSTTPITVGIDRANTGAATPLTFNLLLSEGADRITALSATQSAIASTYQDGYPLGTLAAFGVEENGLIIGAFTNGLSRTLGQVALATFNNIEGLEDVGDNLFRVGLNSGSPVIAEPGSLGTGRIIGGALEQSNVDLGTEFIEMIQTSTGYSAASRIVRTADELLQQLLVLGR
ncbi:MAG: flagellar hook-basal body complex protein [Phycisphaeraceae bacterium]|nr:flagellar hook-basal body complex protein [Phycisphaeraceae bacterium]